MSTMFPKAHDAIYVDEIGRIYILIVHVYSALQVECLPTVNKSLVSMYIHHHLSLGF